MFVCKYMCMGACFERRGENGAWGLIMLKAGTQVLLCVPQCG